MRHDANGLLSLHAESRTITDAFPTPSPNKAARRRNFVKIDVAHVIQKANNIRPREIVDVFVIGERKTVEAPNVVEEQHVCETACVDAADVALEPLNIASYKRRGAYTHLQNDQTIHTIWSRANKLLERHSRPRVPIAELVFAHSEQRQTRTQKRRLSRRFLLLQMRANCLCALRKAALNARKIWIVGIKKQTLADKTSDMLKS